MELAEQDQWKSVNGYIWSMLGTAIGFANLLGFGSQCYRNGGGAFLIPFFAALFVLGIPMLILEGIVGQKTNLPLVTAYGRYAGNKGKFLGWLAILGVVTIGAFYTVLTGWSAAYAYYTAAGTIPDDTATFFTHTFLQASGSLSDFGGISIPALLATAGVVVLSWYVISKNIQSGIEKWCSFFLPLLTVMVFLFVGIVAFLPGAYDGFVLYLRPDYSKLFEFALWRDVFGQLFFSLSLGIGIVVGYSRHNRHSTNLRRAMLSVALADFLISFICGFIIFGCIGYMSQQAGTPFDEMVLTTSIFDIGYVIFPMILSTFGETLSRFVGALFFFCIFIGGITGVFSIVESIAGNVQIEFEASRKRAVTISIAVIGLLTIPFCMGNGTQIIDALAPMVLGNNMLVGGIAQIIVFLFIATEIKNDPVWFKMTRRHPSYLSLKYVCLLILAMSLVFSLYGEYQSGFGLPEMVRFGWLAIAVGIAAFLALRGKPAGSVS